MELIRRLGEPIIHVRTTVTFVAGTTGTVAAHTLFTLTGRIFLPRFTAFCTTGLTETAPTATLNVGTASQTGIILVNPTSGVTDIDTNEWWANNAAGVGPLAGAARLVEAGNTSLSAGPKDLVISEDIIYTVGAQSVSGGVLVFDAWYEPITDDGLLVAA